MADQMCDWLAITQKSQKFVDVNPYNFSVETLLHVLKLFPPPFLLILLHFRNDFSYFYCNEI